VAVRFESKDPDSSGADAQFLCRSEVFGSFLAKQLMAVVEEVPAVSSSGRRFFQANLDRLIGRDMDLPTAIGVVNDRSNASPRR
jgi:hypothetical protein